MKKLLCAVLAAVFMLQSFGTVYAFRSDKPYLKINQTSGTILEMKPSEVTQYEAYMDSVQPDAEYPFEGFSVYEPTEYVTRAELYDILKAKLPQYGKTFDPAELKLNPDSSPITWDDAVYAISVAFGDLPTPKGDAMRSSPKDGEYYADYLDSGFSESALKLKKAGVLLTGYKYYAFPSEADINSLLANIYALYSTRIEDDFYSRVNKEALENDTVKADMYLTTLTTEETTEETTTAVKKHVESTTEITTEFSEDMFDYIRGTLYNASIDTQNEAEKLLEDIIAADYTTLSDKERAVRDFYDSIVNINVRNSLGNEPIQYYLDGLNEAKNTKELVSFTTKHSFYEGSPFMSMAVVTDPENIDKTVLAMTPLTSSKPSYFYSMTESTEYKKYREFVKKLYMLGGDDAETAEKETENLFTAEKKLAAAEYGSESYYTRMYASDLNKMLKLFDVEKLANALGYSTDGQLFIMNLEVFKAVGSLFDGEHTEELRALLKFNELYNSAPYLSEDYIKLFYEYKDHIDADDYFFIKDRTDLKEKAKLITMDYMDAYIGMLYCDKHFDVAYREDVYELVDQIKERFKANINASSWASENTKKRLCEKLDSMKIIIGYPDDVTAHLDLSDIKNTSDMGFYNNVLEIMHSENALNASKQGKPSEALFEEKIYAVEAYYQYYLNSIIIPAGILREPMYSPDYTLEEKLGGAGYIIAHEISHSFDPDNILADKNGEPTEEFTDSEDEAYGDIVEKIANAYEGGQAANSIYTTGYNVVSEAFADISAMECLLGMLSEEEDPDYERFFTLFGTLFYTTGVREAVYATVMMDTHPFGRVRVNSCIKSFDEFYNIYGVKEDDAMYYPKEKRISIWD